MVNAEHPEDVVTTELRLGKALEGIGVHIRPGDDKVVPLPLGGDLVLRLGSPDAQPCYLKRADCLPQLGAEYVLFQPEVVKRDPRQGWLPIGGIHSVTICLGRGESPSLELPMTASREHLHLLLGEADLTLTDTSRNGTWLSLEPQICGSEPSIAP